MNRHFTEQQASDIIKRAAEHQLRERTHDSAAPEGISETELRNVASELGIKGDALATALAEIGKVTENDSGSLKSIKRVLIRTIDREVSDDDLAVITEEFPPITGVGGTTFKLGNTIQYTSAFGVTPCNINISRRKGKTELRVQASAGLNTLPIGAAVILSFLSVIIGIAMLGPLESSGLGVVFTLLAPVALLAAGTWFGRQISKMVNKKILDSVNRTVSKLVELSEDDHTDSIKSSSPEVEVQTRIEN